MKFFKIKRQMNIYIGNLDYNIKEEELKELFDQVGEVSSVKVTIDRMTGRSKGFGFVEMPNDSEALAAIEKLNGLTLKDRALRVTEARPKTENKNYNSYNKPRRYED